MPPVYWRIALCETSANPHHHTRDYQGMFGFYYGSWDQYKPKGYPEEAYQATMKQQYAVARIIAEKYGFSRPWGCYRQHSWVRNG